MEGFKNFLLFLDQVRILCYKHFMQKFRNGRSTLKETIVIPFVAFLFTGVLMLSANSQIFPSAYYQLHALPPLSSHGDYGIFNPDAIPNNDDSLGYVNSRRLYYSPDTHEGVNELMAALELKYPQVHGVPMPDSSAIIEDYKKNLFDTWGAIEFTLSADQISSGDLIDPGTANTVDYNIRLSPSVAIIPSDGVDDFVFNDNLAGGDVWSDSGYLTLQNFINTYLAGLQVEGTVDVYTYLQRYPKTVLYGAQIDFDMATIRFFLWKWMAPTIYTICLFVPMLGLLTQLVREKQYKMKDVLEISGLFAVSWWVSFLVIIFFVTQITIWIGGMLLLAMQVLTTGDFFAYVGLLSCFVLPLATFSFALSHLLNISEYYGLPTFIANMAFGVCGVFVANATNITMGAKLFIGILLPPINLAVGIFQIENWNYHHDANEGYDMNYVDKQKELPSVNLVCLCLLFSALIYLGIALGYPFDFLFKGDENEVVAQASRVDLVTYHCDNEEAEEEANGVKHESKVLLEVDDICQIYPDGTQAVKGISFKVRDGEVLSYLGANGAGKSTTMGMLCGTLEPTYGDAKVNGFSISRQRPDARRNLGICMQQDIIWDDVTVEDHLYIFARIRGLSGQQLSVDVQNMLNSLGFPEKAKSLAGTLSGGQKRRLCVGLAMVGGNPVVFLDEPTAGLDPVSRRQLWELVQKNRKGRAILLTTHFMDEADVLGDRIAIVKDGRLRALGSSKFLKKRFGMGYLLRNSLKADTTDVSTITSNVQKFIPSASVVSFAGTELAIRLPKSGVKVFPQMMEWLETEGKSHGIVTFGIETTTLEEVFMRIVNEDTETMLSNPEEASRMLGASKLEREKYEADIEKKEAARNPFTEEKLKLLLQKGSESAPSKRFWDQLSCLLWKRRHQFDRSRGQFTFEVVVPIAMIILLAVVLTLIPESTVGSEPSYTDVTTYNSMGFSTPITAENSVVAQEYADAAGILGATFVGDNYTSLYNYIDAQSDAPVFGQNSVDGVYWEALDNFTVMYNVSVPNDLPAIVTMLLDAAIGSATNYNLTVNTACQALPENTIDDQANFGLIYVFMVALLFGSLGGGMSIVLSGERVNLVKHQQLASGTSKWVYWLSNFLFDFSVMFAALLIFILAMACADYTNFGGQNAGNILGMGIVFIFAALFRFFAISFIVNDVRIVQSFYFYGSLMLIFILATVWIQVVFNANGGNVGATSSKITSYVCAVIDPNFGFVLFCLFYRNFLGGNTMYPGIGNDLILPIFISFLIAFASFMFIEGASDFEAVCTYFWLLIFGGKRITDDANTRTSLFNNSTLADDEELNYVEDSTKTRQSLHVREIKGSLDDDVVAEKKRVADVLKGRNLNNGEHAIFISELTKIFPGRGTVPTKAAVNGVSVAIGLGEVFGLLGANGAGKTTLLKIVSGLELPTTGKAYINGHNVVTHRTDAQRSMGLCPQFDTLIERLSVRENLLFFAHIKGICVNVDDVCEAYMNALNIKKYENKLIQHLSGGNRRKVSLAVALLGCPPTVYLDEPSTGLDPVASRLMWRLLSRVASTKSNAIVLTTHNMLECEAVCTRIGVMKNGELVCLGDSQHLRTVHGTGFLLEITLTDVAAVDAAKQFVAQNFLGAEVVDEHATMINFEIPATAIKKLSAAFRLIEENCARLKIGDYALSQSTLEQVFLKQVRPSGVDSETGPRLQSVSNKYGDKPTPTFADYFNGYCIWLIAGLVPGLHQFYLGDTWRGFKYLFTLNELIAGWLLDLFEMHVLIQKRVEKYGNSRGIGSCLCCLCCSPTTQTHKARGDAGEILNPTSDMA